MTETANAADGTETVDRAASLRETSSAYHTDEPLVVRPRTGITRLGFLVRAPHSCQATPACRAQAIRVTEWQERYRLLERELAITTYERDRATVERTAHSWLWALGFMGAGLLLGLASHAPVVLAR